jgi:hypothetical protein
MAKKSLPYDAEVEYLESNGIDNIFINTLVPIQEGLDIKCEFLINSFTSYGTIFGNINRPLLVRQYSTTGKIQCNLLPNSTLYTDTVVIPVNEWHIVQYKVFDTEQSCTLDGRVIAADTRSFNNKYVEKIYLFAAHPKQVSNMRIRRFSVKLHGELILDYIPFRVGQVGYMYDKVSRQLFGNSGTGAFVVGPDVISGG